jgi:hypothetical protein
MSLLDVPRCPNCNSIIDLTELWDAAPKSQGGSLIVRPVGLACPTGGVKLKVLQRPMTACGMSEGMKSRSNGRIVRSPT